MPKRLTRKQAAICGAIVSLRPPIAVEDVQRIAECPARKTVMTHMTAIRRTLAEYGIYIDSFVSITGMTGTPGTRWCCMYHISDEDRVKLTAILERQGYGLSVSKSSNSDGTCQSQACSPEDLR